MYNIILGFRAMTDNSQHILGLAGPAATTINAFKEVIYMTSGFPSWVTTHVL